MMILILLFHSFVLFVSSNRIIPTAYLSEIRRIGCSLYTISGLQHRSIFSKTVPFLRRLQDYCCGNWREAQDVKILEAYDHTLHQKEKDPRSFTLPCFIHSVCFDKTLVNLGASVSVMPFSTYTNLGLGNLSHTRLTIELAERTIKQPKGITEKNSLMMILILLFHSFVLFVSSNRIIPTAYLSEIRRIGCSLYTISGLQHRSIFSKTVPFLRRLQDYCCGNWREAQDVKILEAYDHTLHQKEKDPRSFTLPCFIHSVCFDKTLVNLGASVSVMPFSTYTNLGLGNLSHTRLTIELAERTIKQPKGITEKVLVRIGKFIFSIDFIILDIPEDDDVPLILGRLFLSTAHSKIDVYKRKFTLR
nr:hypothetical protein [Tanacetum cinerariifolium]